jgi:Ricin-type beta-trefoil lectin domain
MGEPNKTDSGRADVSGFARTFAAATKQEGNRDRPRVTSRMTVVGLVIAVVVAGAVGAGALVAYQRGQHDKTQNTSSDRKIEATARPTGSPSPSVTPRSVKKPSQNRPGAPTHVSAAQAPAPGRGSAAGSTGATTTTGKAGGKTASRKNGPTLLQTRSIISFASSRCIDVTNGQSVSGSRLQIWDCSGANWQQWSFYSDGTIRSLGKCMAVAGNSTTDGARIVLATCDGSASQKFTLNGNYDLVNQVANKCVDVTNQQTANGTPLQLWDCSGTSNQKWHEG